ncbi:hypothetical protein UFOVP255_14 [uncultured Caudovirales phage]|uniref:Uncharacterized protein n=1 Tax=uncultured Caudovirales phage TaxID=2100421 RepID=A0A6J5LCT6_9CAUD|nr:hypothetical protein UFOVP255_14 [uncultured Caudovirales phage]
MHKPGIIPIFKADPLDVHDRLSFVKEQQSENIADVIKMFIKKDPFGGYPFYLFSHSRLHENGSSTRVIWQPRLTKPKAQTNSMLFRLNPKKDDEVMVMWMIPEREKWHLYSKGSMFENPIVVESVESFQNDRQRLEAPEQDDLPDHTVQEILRNIYPNLFRGIEPVKPKEFRLFEDTPC